MDFLIYYEHIAREIETACLLAVELRRRGYTVKITNIYSLRRMYYRPKVIIVPYLYHDNDVFEMSTFLLQRSPKMVNLQFEQIFNQKGISSDFFVPSGLAAHAIQICWGQYSYDRLLKNGISASRLKTTGHPSVDMNSDVFRKTLYSREELSNIYGIKNNTKWHLFISSFSYTTLSKKELISIEKKIGSGKEFYRLSNETKIEYLKWVKEFLKNNKNDSLIYRPHPNEKLSQELIEMKKECPNFYYVGELSIRQWISVCDTITLWISTSIVDAFYANKNCCIVRPIKIPADLEPVLTIGAIFTNTKEDYFYYLKSGKLRYDEFPIKSETIENFYGEKSLCGKIHRRVADVCVDALDDCPLKVVYPKGYKIKRFLLDIFASFCGIIPEKVNLGRYEVFHQKMRKEKKSINTIIMKYTNIFEKTFLYE
nr:surface carbohydrate biosynthesis protein [uncultured Sphaerochaeta sp.]